MTGDGSRRLLWTVHANERSRERGIAPQVAELAYLEGRRLRGCGDRFLLTEERVRELRSEGAYWLRLLATAEQAAPVVAVVSEASTLVTVFRPGRGVDRRWRRPRGRRSAS